MRHANFHPKSQPSTRSIIPMCQNEYQPDKNCSPNKQLYQLRSLLLLSLLRLGCCRQWRALASLFSSELMNSSSFISICFWQIFSDTMCRALSTVCSAAAWYVLSYFKYAKHKVKFKRCMKRIKFTLGYVAMSNVSMSFQHCYVEIKW